MKHKVSELDGALLDYLVARAEGHTWRCPWMLEEQGMAEWQSYEQAWGNPTPKYSEDWAFAGPLIEREAIAIYRYSNPKEWTAGFDLQIGDGPGVYMEYQEHGPTPLIAAMRCFVSSKFGDTVDLPE